MKQQIIMDQGHHIIEAYRSHSDIPHSLRLIWTRNRSVLENLYRKRHNIKKETEVLALGGIRTHSPPKKGFEPAAPQKGFEPAAPKKDIRTRSPQKRDSNPQSPQKGFETAAPKKGIRTRSPQKRDSNPQPPKKGIRTRSPKKASGCRHTP